MRKIKNIKTKNIVPALVLALLLVGCSNANVESTDIPSQTETEGTSQTQEPSSTLPTESDSQEPTETETQKPTETETQKPTETETQKPTETETQKPTETETQEPTESESQEPTETETQKPTETETQKPTETETQEPTESESQEPDEPELDDRLAKYIVNGEVVVNMDKHKDLYIKNYSNWDEYYCIKDLYDYVQIKAPINLEGSGGDNEFPEYYVGKIQYSSNTSAEDLKKVRSWFDDLARKKLHLQYPEYSGSNWSGMSEVLSVDELEGLCAGKQTFSTTTFASASIYEGSFFDQNMIFLTHMYVTVVFEYVE